MIMGEALKRSIVQLVAVVFLIVLPYLFGVDSCDWPRRHLLVRPSTLCVLVEGSMVVIYVHCCAVVHWHWLARCFAQVSCYK